MGRFLCVWVGLSLLGVGFLLAACGESDGPEAAISLDTPSTATLMPTPSLAPGLPTAPPPTPIPAESDAESADSSVTVPSRTSVPTLTPFPTATSTPEPAARLDLAQRALHNGNYEAAIEHLEAGLRQTAVFSEAEQETMLLLAGRAYLAEEQFQAAAAALQELLARTAGEGPDAAYYHLGQANAALDDWQGAIGAYQTYLDRHPEMAAYVYPAIAEAYTNLGDADNTRAAYESALIGPAHRLVEINTRRRLAEIAMAAEEYDAAIAQYDAIRSLAQTEFTRGEMTYLAGTAALMAGDIEVAYARFRQGVTDFPRAYESYLGLVELVEAGVAVNEFQRGLVNFHASAYEPAVAAFERYLAADLESVRADAYLYLAWSYEALGNRTAALAALDNYAILAPERAALERANLLARLGDIESAVAAYEDYFETYPDGEDAPQAAWQAAAMTAQLDDVETAVARYRYVADAYPSFADAPEALFRAGWLAYGQEDVETAVTVWYQAAADYRATEYGAAARVWLLRTLPDYESAAMENETEPETEEPAEIETEEAATAVPPTATPLPAPDAMLDAVARWSLAARSTDYYTLRARDVANERPPFTSDANLQLPDEETAAADQREAEAWLRDWLGLDSAVNVRDLDPILTNSDRFVLGDTLWQLGEFEAARLELETLRSQYTENALFSYQLALYFRDIGLYRSSILAVSSVLQLSGQTVFEAPAFIGRLAYPVYYAELIVPLAEQYEYDPRLQFALVRQESLFESFARSGAAAQGLSQVIPDTGAYIARLLTWPDFENNDLYRPYVGLNFGAFYLSQQLNGFDGHIHAALAAYNAGPGNAANWYETAGGDHDLYLETVNFAETRLYIERIYVGYNIYAFLYAGD